jgi:uncharacterized protein
MLLRPAHAKPIGQCCAIAIMAKASIPGQTKTRLSPPLTPIEAADLNTAFLRDIINNVARAAEQADIASFVAFGPPGAAPFFEDCLPAHVGLMEVWLPDLGECLIQTAQSLLDLGYGAAVVLNSDSPTLPTERLVATARALAAPGERIVLGPCEDGGYYLLGLKHPHRRLFQDIAWSTQRVARQTLERAGELDLEVVRLGPWYDVDDLDSLRKLIGETAAGSANGGMSGAYFPSHSAAVLRRLIDAADFADRIGPVRDAAFPAASIA